MGVFRWYSIPFVAAILAAVTCLSAQLTHWLPVDTLPIQLNAGVALAALIVHGLRSWPGVFLGVFGASLLLTGGLENEVRLALFDAGVISVQALVGALFVRPLLREGLAVSRDSEVLRFLLMAGPVACLVSALATQVPRLHGPAFAVLEPWIGGLVPQDWLTAWSTNTLGVLMAGPTALALWMGRQPVRRARGVVLPLVLAGVLVVIGHVALLRFETREMELEDSARLEAVLQGGLVHFERGIEALHSVAYFFQASRHVDADEFGVFTSQILRWPGLESIEWVPRVVDGKSVLENGPSGDEQDWRRGVERYPSQFSVTSVRRPRTRVEDYSEVASRWTAMEQARDSGRVTAAEPQPLLQTGRPGLTVFVPLYRSGFDSANASVEARRDALRGFIKGNFDLASLVQPLAETAAGEGVELALVDLTPGSPPMILLSNLPADVRTGERRHFTFAGRLFQLDLAVSQARQPGTGPVARLYQGFSVLAMFLICQAVLASAGRHSAAQAAVLARTAALRASERHLEVTLDSIGDGVLVADTTGFVTRLNPMAEQLTGWRSRQAQGRPLAEVFQIVREETGEPLAISVAEVLASGGDKRLGDHTVLIRSDGSTCVIAHSAAPILGAEGEPLGMVLVFRDISEERAAERALAASEQRYRELIEQAPYGIFVQTGGRFSYLNPTALRLLGARRQSELLGKEVLDFLHPDNRVAVAERIRQLNLLGIPSPSREEKWVRIDGTVFHAEATAAPHVHDGERGALVMLRDISARKAAEIQRDRFFDLSLDPQCILDASGKFLRVNAAFSEVLGWTEQEFLGSCYLDLIHPEDRAHAEREHGSTRADNAAQRLEVRFKRHIGDWRWLSWNAIADEHGGLIYAVARDVTERRETIQALTSARHEAEYANRAKSAFLATMSHEIRTPMNAVVGLAEVLTRSTLGEHEEELVRNISLSARSLLRLIDDILDFSKIEAGRLELEQGAITIEAMVEDVCIALLPMARERGVLVSVFVAPELPRQVMGDETRLRQLLNNLIGNAIKFSASPHEASGRVWVRVEPGTENTLQLTVKDNGIGMSQQTLAHIFQPFTQGELSTTRRYGGTGLGLAISKRLVELMGGDIHLDSCEGEGTTATLTLSLLSIDSPACEVESNVDLTGVHCVLVEAGQLPASDWQRYLLSAGASTVGVPTLADALGYKGEPGQMTVVLLDMREPAHGSLPVHADVTDDQQMRFVLVDTARRGLPRVQSGKMVVVEGGALRRRQLLQAVALATGRVGSSVTAPGEELPQAVSAQCLPPPTGEHRILVVEDDDMNRKVIIEQLRVLGYTADVARDGASALALWRKKHYDLVLSDLHMPEMDGYDFVRTVRTEENASQRTPVVVLTANAMQGEGNRALACGFDDYLTKPVSLAALDVVLRHWLTIGTEGHGGRGSESADNNGARTEHSEEEHPEMGGGVMAATAMETQRSESAPLRTSSVLDLAILSEFIGDDDSRVQGFVVDYREAARQLREKILAAHDQGDLEAVASFAHRLKSSSRWVGAVSLGKACEHLEKAGHTGNSTDVENSLARFVTIHDETLAAIDRYLGALSS